MSFSLFRRAGFLIVIAVGIAYAFFSHYQEHNPWSYVWRAEEQIARNPDDVSALQQKFELGLYYEKNGMFREAYATFDEVAREKRRYYPNIHYGYLHDEALWKARELEPLARAQAPEGDFSARP